MKTIQQMTTAATVLILATLMGCAGMTAQERGTAIGAGAGAIGGAVLCGGVLCTVGGAAVGGVIGHEINKPK
jgi:osmotically inducible lipoprotein OsmB